MIMPQAQATKREQFDAFLAGLLRCPWNDPQCPLQLNDRLTAEDVAGSSLYQNARLLMTTLRDEKGTPTTATGNLTRAFVARLQDRLVIPASKRELLTEYCKVVNEMNIWDLHRARVVCECAGLIARRKSRFNVTKKGRLLLEDGRAGELYRTLFVGCFERFNLSYDFPFREVKSIQAGIAVSLWRLDVVAQNWVPVRGIAEHILLPEVHDELRAAMFSPHDTEEWILAGYILDPLSDFGLIERQKPAEWRHVDKNALIRVTPLWLKFISFMMPPLTPTN
jgi:hypothetical protein